MVQLVSTSLAGNLHAASDTVNKMGLAAYVLKMEFTGGSSIVVFRVPDKMAPALRRHLGVLPGYTENPVPEHYWRTAFGEEN